MTPGFDIAVYTPKQSEPPPGTGRALGSQVFGEPGFPGSRLAATNLGTLTYRQLGISGTDSALNHKN